MQERGSSGLECAATDVMDVILALHDMYKQEFRTKVSVLAHQCGYAHSAKGKGK